MATSLTEYTFSLDVLMDEIMRINQLRVSEIYDKDNNTLVERYSITESDADTIKIFITNAVYDLVEVSMPIMSSLTDAIKTDDPYGVVVNNYGNANASVKEGVENAFKQIIVTSSLMQWYEMKGLAEDMKLWAMKLERLKKQDVKRRMYQLKLR